MSFITLVGNYYSVSAVITTDHATSLTPTLLLLLLLVIVSARRETGNVPRKKIEEVLNEK